MKLLNLILSSIMINLPFNKNAIIESVNENWSRCWELYLYK